jgi:hypothetical protein
MESKTPKSDKLMYEILEKLVPHKRICKWKGEHKHCEGEFEIVPEDITFLKMLRVPPSDFCPTCRRIRRMSHMSQFRFFKRPCDAPQHKEEIISIFSVECSFPVYDYKYFISDEFDPFSYGIKYEKNASPLSRLLEMRKTFPMPSFLNRDPGSINSDYSNGGRGTKNVYYAFGCFGSENVWYSHMAGQSKDIMNSAYIHKSDHVYDGVHSDNIYKSIFTYFSKNCADCMFVFDCRNCQDCFGCVNLRNKRYQIFNKQFSKEDYESFIKSISPLSRQKIKEYEQKLWDLVKTLPLNASRNIASNNASGILLENTKDAHDVVDCQNSENIRHVDGALSHKDSMDMLFSGGHSSFLYGTTNIGSQSSNVRFSVSCKFCNNSEFIFNSKNLDNCFMCFGLQNKSYCILNVQYEPEEYFKIIDEIKSEMIKRGEYTDPIGLEFSAQAYNFCIGQNFFPLTSEEIIKLGGYTALEPETNVGNIKVLSVDEIPQTIDEVTDDIINCAIKCEKSGKPFRITASELAFLRKIKIPLPTTHPTVRMESKVALAPVGHKYSAQCHKCNKDIYSLFNPQENYLLYCEDCYKQEVY